MKRLLLLIFVFLLAATHTLCAQSRTDGEKVVATDKLVKVYPNPLPEGFEMKMVYDVSVKTEVEIYFLDALGNVKLEQTVLFTPEANYFSMNTIDLSKGVYMMKVINKNNNDIEIRKVVVR